MSEKRKVECVRVGDFVKLATDFRSLRVVEIVGDDFVGLDREGVARNFKRHEIYIALEGLTTADWRNADLVLSASNGGAVVHGFSTSVHRLQAEAEFLGEGTEWIHYHPIFIAYVMQLSQLSGATGSNAIRAIDTIHARLREAGEKSLNVK